MDGGQNDFWTYGKLDLAKAGATKTVYDYKKDNEPDLNFKFYFIL